MSDQAWWRGAVIYQIYPRSFMDSNGDGIGDLVGIMEKLPYVKQLGVDAIWISPFFKSPMKDFGYDISDYRDIEPMFGQLQDFERLLEHAKQQDLKIIIDQVLSHTSDQHPWFMESRQNKTNPKADWYVWADAKDDGTPPNNWLSIFGGGAWQWEPRRQQYYLHNFLTAQPDLNFYNPQVRAQVLANIEFWLNKGVDGFRLDAINFCFHDRQLRDNPAKAAKDRKGRGFSEDNPYAYQYHYFNNTQPENIDFIEDIRALMDKFPGAVTLGEISSENSLATMAQYTQGNTRLHMAYSFELLCQDFSPAYIRDTVTTLEQHLIDGWPCWAIGNHDVMRVLTRWGQGQGGPALAKMLNALLGSLRGSICSYQGEELGLEEADIAFADLQDPFGINFWPMFKGRDGCRTPMPWLSEQAQAGFSSASNTWLPMAPSHQHNAVDVQQQDKQSVLTAYQTFFQWRKSQSALIHGDIRFIDTPSKVLGLIRSYQGTELLACFNFSASSQNLTLSAQWQLSVLDGHGFSAVTSETVTGGTRIELPPYQVYFAQRTWKELV